jgi:hypothetical protein
MTTWQDALDQAFVQNQIDNSGSVNIYNSDFLEGRTQTSTTAGSIQIDGGGVYTVTNASTATEVTDLNEEEVDETLTQLGVADSGWGKTFWGGTL